MIPQEEECIINDIHLCKDYDDASTSLSYESLVIEDKDNMFENMYVWSNGNHLLSYGHICEESDTYSWV